MLHTTAQSGTFYIAKRGTSHIAATIENFALDLRKAKRIVIPNQPNAVPPDSAVD
jgi:hypothetical protein